MHVKKNLIRGVVLCIMAYACILPIRRSCERVVLLASLVSQRAAAVRQSSTSNFRTAISRASGSGGRREWGSHGFAKAGLTGMVVTLSSGLMFWKNKRC